jgi:hypothetical protein
MKLAYAFPGALLVCAPLLSCFQGASPAAAQELTTLCSKRNPNFRQTGILKRLDERNYVLLTENGSCLSREMIS